MIDPYADVLARATCALSVDLTPDTKLLRPTKYLPLFAMSTITYRRLIFLLLSYGEQSESVFPLFLYCHPYTNHIFLDSLR
jgi:hypothetical protein